MMVFCEWLMEGVTFIHPHQTQDEFFYQSHATSFSVNKKDRTGRTGEKIKREERREKVFLTLIQLHTVTGSGKLLVFAPPL